MMPWVVGTRVLAAVVLVAVVVPPAPVRATDDVVIRDNAHVLMASDLQAIRAAAHVAAFGVVAYTVEGGFAGNQNGFIQAAQRDVPDNAVVVAADPKDRYTHVAARRDTGLTAAQLRSAHMTGDRVSVASGWGAGMVAALRDLAQLDPAKSSPFPWAFVISGVLLVLVVAFLAWRLLRPAGRRRHLVRR